MNTGLLNVVNTRINRVDDSSELKLMSDPSYGLDCFLWAFLGKKGNMKGICTDKTGIQGFVFALRSLAEVRRCR